MQHLIKLKIICLGSRRSQWWIWRGSSPSAENSMESLLNCPPINLRKKKQGRGSWRRKKMRRAPLGLKVLEMGSLIRSAAAMLVSSCSAPACAMWCFALSKVTRIQSTQPQQAATHGLLHVIDQVKCGRQIEKAAICTCKAPRLLSFIVVNFIEKES